MVENLNTFTRIRVKIADLTLSSLNLSLSSSSSLQAMNCYHNSRLVVDEDDLKWVKMKKIYCYF